MFKENKEFWMYFVGIVAMFFFIFFIMRQNAGNAVNQILGPMFSGATAVPTLNVSTPQPTSAIVDINRTYLVTLSTNKGDIVVNLLPKNAPNTVTNFVSLINSKYFDGTKFYRLIPNVLIQGGSRNTLNADPNDDKFGGPGYTIKDEINWDSLDFDDILRGQLTQEGFTSTPVIASKDIKKYELAMASSLPNTAGSQFFIVLGDESDPRVLELRGRHTVFGEVVQGQEIIDGFNNIAVDDLRSSSPRPVEDIIINSTQLSIQ